MSTKENNHVISHDGYVSREERLQRYGHRSGVVWFRGLSASGKSTIAHRLERVLFEKGVKTYALDGELFSHLPRMYSTPEIRPDFSESKKKAVVEKDSSTVQAIPYQ